MRETARQPLGFSHTILSIVAPTGVSIGWQSAGLLAGVQVASVPAVPSDAEPRRLDRGQQGQNRPST